MSFAGHQRSLRIAALSNENPYRPDRIVDSLRGGRHGRGSAPSPSRYIGSQFSLDCEPRRDAGISRTSSVNEVDVEDPGARHSSPDKTKLHEHHITSHMKHNLWTQNTNALLVCQADGSRSYLQMPDYLGNLPQRSILIENAPLELDEEEARRVLVEYGTIKKLSLQRGGIEIQYHDIDSAFDVVENCHNTCLFGTDVPVNIRYVRVGQTYDDDLNTPGPFRVVRPSKAIHDHIEQSIAIAKTSDTPNSLCRELSPPPLGRSLSKVARDLPQIDGVRDKHSEQNQEFATHAGRTIYSNGTDTGRTFYSVNKAAKLLHEGAANVSPIKAHGNELCSGQSELSQSGMFHHRNRLSLTAQVDVKINQWRPTIADPGETTSAAVPSHSIPESAFSSHSLNETTPAFIAQENAAHHDEGNEEASGFDHLNYLLTAARKPATTAYRLPGHTLGIHDRKRASNTPLSELTSGSSNSGRRRKCGECKGSEHHSMPLIPCVTCARHYHARCGDPSPGTDVSNFSCGRCIQKGRAPAQAKTIATSVASVRETGQNSPTVACFAHPTGDNEAGSATMLYQHHGSHETATEVVVQSLTTSQELDNVRKDLYSGRTVAYDVANSRDIRKPSAPLGPQITEGLISPDPVVEKLIPHSPARSKNPHFSSDAPRRVDDGVVVNDGGCSVNYRTKINSHTPEVRRNRDLEPLYKEDMQIRDSQYHPLPGLSHDDAYVKASTFPPSHKPWLEYNQDIIKHAQETARRYKQVTCSAWSDGVCRRLEDDCMYAHRDTGLYLPTRTTSAKSRWTCDRRVDCSWREWCRYSHEDTGYYVNAAGKALMKHLTCYWFWLSGRCSKHDGCPYAHYWTGSVAANPTAAPLKSSHERKMAPITQKASVAFTSSSMHWKTGGEHAQTVTPAALPAENGHDTGLNQCLLLPSAAPIVGRTTSTQESSQSVDLAIQASGSNTRNAHIFNETEDPRGRGMRIRGAAKAAASSEGRIIEDAIRTSNSHLVPDISGKSSNIKSVFKYKDCRLCGKKLMGSDLCSACQTLESQTTETKDGSPTREQQTAEALEKAENEAEELEMSADDPDESAELYAGKQSNAARMAASTLSRSARKRALSGPDMPLFSRKRSKPDLDQTYQAVAMPKVQFKDNKLVVEKQRTTGDLTEATAREQVALNSADPSQSTPTELARRSTLGVNITIQSQPDTLTTSEQRIDDVEQSALDLELDKTNSPLPRKETDFQSRKRRRPSISSSDRSDVTRSRLSQKYVKTVFTDNQAVGQFCSSSTNVLTEADDNVPTLDADECYRCLNATLKAVAKLFPISECRVSEIVRAALSSKQCPAELSRALQGLESQEYLDTQTSPFTRSKTIHEAADSRRVLPADATEMLPVAAIDTVDAAAHTLPQNIPDVPGRELPTADKDDRQGPISSTTEVASTSSRAWSSSSFDATEETPATEIDEAVNPAKESEQTATLITSGDLRYDAQRQHDSEVSQSPQDLALVVEELRQIRERYARLQARLPGITKIPQAEANVYYMPDGQSFTRQSCALPVTGPSSTRPMSLASPVNASLTDLNPIKAALSTTFDPEAHIARLKAQGFKFEHSDDSEDDLYEPMPERDDPPPSSKAPLPVLLLPRLTKGQALKGKRNNKGEYIRGSLLVRNRAMTRNLQLYGNAHQDVNRIVKDTTVYAKVQRITPSSNKKSKYDSLEIVTGEEKITFAEFSGMEKEVEVEACLSADKRGLAFRKKEVARPGSAGLGWNMKMAGKRRRGEQLWVLADK